MPNILDRDSLASTDSNACTDSETSGSMTSDCVAVSPPSAGVGVAALGSVMVGVGGSTLTRGMGDSLTGSGLGVDDLTD